MRIALGLLVILVLATLRAEAAQARTKPDQLRACATHVITGRIGMIYERRGQPGGLQDVRYLAEVPVETVEKGEGTEPGRPRTRTLLDTRVDESRRSSSEQGRSDVLPAQGGRGPARRDRQGLRGRESQRVQMPHGESVGATCQPALYLFGGAGPVQA